MILIRHEKKINKKKTKTVTKKITVMKTKAVKKVIKINYNSYSLNNF